MIGIKTDFVGDSLGKSQFFKRFTLNVAEMR